MGFLFGERCELTELRSRVRVTVIAFVFETCGAGYCLDQFSPTVVGVRERHLTPGDRRVGDFANVAP